MACFKCTLIVKMLIFEAVEDLAMMYKHMSLLKHAVCRNSSLHSFTGYRNT